MKVTEWVSLSQAFCLGRCLSPGTKVSLTLSQASRPYYFIQNVMGFCSHLILRHFFFLFLASDTGLQVAILIHIDLSLKQPKALKLTEGHWRL